MSVKGEHFARFFSILPFNIVNIQPLYKKTYAKLENQTVAFS